MQPTATRRTRSSSTSCPASRARSSSECGNCHAEYLSTYRDTFHGQVTELGYARIATCASCHGAHEILPASEPGVDGLAGEPRSRRARSAMPAPAPISRSFDPHANRHDEARNPLYCVRRDCSWNGCCIGVFAFFGIHTVFWLCAPADRASSERANGVQGEA